MIVKITSNLAKSQCSYGFKIQTVTSFANLNLRRDHSTSSDVSFVKENPLTAALRRGTGGRSSFNGHVVTVFGATGCTGRKVVSRLCSQGCQVVIPYRCDPSTANQLKVAGDLGQIMFLPFSIRNEESVYKAVKYSDTVVNLIGAWHDTPAYTIEESNHGAASIISKMSKAAGVRKFVHMSALNASPNPTPVVLKKGSRFLKSKFESEEVVKEHFPDAVIFRPAMMFGEQSQWFFLFHSARYKRIRYVTYLWNQGKGIFKMPVDTNDVTKGIATAVCDDKIKDVTIDCIGPHRYEYYHLVNYLSKIMRLEGARYPAVCDLKYGILARLKTTIKPLLYYNYRHTWEFVEYESVSDRTTKTNPTLEDLGINLAKLEDRAYGLLRKQARLYYVKDVFDEMRDIPDAPYEVVH